MVCDKLKSQFKTKKRTTFAKPQSRSFIAAGLSQAPVLLRNSASMLFCCLTNALLVEIGLDVSPENVSAYCPNKDGLYDMMDEEASKTLAIIRQRMNDAKLFFSCDGANKKAFHHVIKVTPWCHRNVMNALTESNAATGDNKKLCRALMCIFEK